MKSIRLFIFLVSMLSVSVSFGQNSYKIPTEDWSLMIDLDGFKVEKEMLSKDNSMFRLSAINKKSKQNLSLFIEKAMGDGDKIACRDYYWGKAVNSPLQKENLKMHETDILALVEFDTEKFNGITINMHNVNAYLANKGYWIDVHISKIGYSEKDKKNFEKILQSISIKNE